MTLLTLREVAAVLQVDYTTALSYVQSKALPAKQLPGRKGAKGNRWRVRAEDLDTFMDVGPADGPEDRDRPQFTAINRRDQKKEAGRNAEWMQRYGR